ncbi:MAG: hypothetical protein LBE13_09675, partial [Bacteroidales bacterium]|nr:hypothetical protein [Bacteroidales bacterium]
VYVKADNEQEARRKLIEINNLNGDFVESVFSEFVSDLDLDLLDYNIPGLDLEKIDKKLQDVMEDVPELDIEEMKQEVKMIKIVCPECQYIFEVEA